MAQPTPRAVANSIIESTKFALKQIEEGDDYSFARNEIRIDIFISKNILRDLSHRKSIRSSFVEEVYKYLRKNLELSIQGILHASLDIQLRKDSILITGKIPSSPIPIHLESCHIFERI